jgi:hypothetical protein
VGINADECPHNKILEAEAVPKSRHDDDVQATGEGVPDLMQRSIHANQPNDVVVLIAKATILIAKATTKLMDRQAPRGMTKGGRRVGEGETERRRGMKNRRRREA